MGNAGRRIEVDSAKLTLRAYEGDRLVFEFDCVLGGTDTPTKAGRFKIEWSDKTHVSGQSGRPMPFSLFFDEGRAIHGGTNVEIRHLAMRAGIGRLDNFLPDGKKVGSHGCVNLRPADAEQLFGWARIGTPVWVK